MAVIVMILTKDNYYSPESNRYYMSHSQYQNFRKCEFMAMAIINEEWADEPTEEMLVGSLLHSWNEGTMEKLEHEEIYSTKGPTKGQLKSKFLFVDQMIATLENDPFCMFVLEGQKEVVMTAEMFGVPWKIRVDSYNPGKRRLVDLKTTRSITELVWSNERWAKVSFIEAYHYLTQMAIYCEVERLATGQTNWCEPLIVAVSKETPPDKAVISLNDPRRLQQELAEIQASLPRIIAVKNGEIEPARCEQCAFCRSSKRLSTVMFYKQLEDF